MKVLDVHSFSVKFQIDKKNYFEAVKSIGFSINQGEIFGLIGESGSGKSVTSQSLTRLINDAKLSGNVFFTHNEKSIDLLQITIDELDTIRQQGISYIFQEPMTALNPLINCGKQILEIADNKSNEYLKELLHKVELYEDERIAESYPHELSGGQRQRVMIAMSLANKPKLLIADEPTTALDIAVQTEILDLLKKICRQDKMSILFITHDILSLEGFADQIAVMYHGEIVETNTTKLLMNNPKHPYTKALFESRATYAKKGKQLSEISDILSVNQDGFTFTEPKEKQLETSKVTDQIVVGLDKVNKSHFQKKLFKSLETKVLHSIDIEVNEGEILGIIGESGSGKSTIAKIILNIWKATSGQVKIEDKSINEHQHLGETIQLVFQDPFSSLNPKHRVGNAIVEVLNTLDAKGSKKSVKNKAVSLLKEVGLSELDFNKYPHEFSGGQRQRICIAKALAKNPKIIVLDEAVSALDVSVQAKVLNLLNELKQKKGLTYILISHDMNVVSYFCNRIVVLKEGKIVESGGTRQLIENPSSDYTRSLMEHSIK